MAAKVTEATIAISATSPVLKSRGLDPVDYVGAHDLLPLLDDDFAVERHAVEARIDPPPGTPHVADVVRPARRS
jgi:hypothetical protein